MDFLRKHYEKVLLGVVLVGLTLAMVGFGLKISSERAALNELRDTLVNPKVVALSNVDLTLPQASLKRLDMPSVLDLAHTNRVFNPMTWLKSADGRLVRLEKAGPSSALATNFVPLYLRMTFDSVSVGADGTVKYVIGVERQASPNPGQRPKRQTYAKVGEKNDPFTIQSVGGPVDNPNNLVLTLNDTGENATITKEQPYSRIEGYMADVRYELEKKNWPARRVGAVLNLNMEDYKIVAISSNEVVLLAPNQKKWPVTSHVAP